MQKMLDVHQIKAHFQCPQQYSELTSKNIVQSEFTVEEIVGLQLATLFDHVKMDEVLLGFVPASMQHDAQITISIRARGYRPLLAIDPANLDCAVEGHLAGALAELFGAIDIKQCVVHC
jgi:hypothetical protein